MKDYQREKKIIDFAGLANLRQQLEGKKIVHCHGVFDVLHAGHLSYFESAKKFGDCLVVTITSDEFVNKGPGRPYFNSTVRANMIGALEIVDYVAISHFPVAVPSIEILMPDFYVKGPDYKVMTNDATGGIFKEEQAVQKFGGKLVFTEDPTFSSSALVNRFFYQWSDEQLKMINTVKAEGGYELIEKILNQVSKQNVCVIGEPIVDTYVFCSPEAISSKSPSISAKFLFEENYAGGSLAIANHLADFVNEVSLVTTHGGERYFRDLLDEKLDKRIKLVDEVLENVPTPRKTRYISADKSQRIFEITDTRFDQWSLNSSKKFCDTVKKCSDPNGVTLLADFGHGLFENSVLNTLPELSGFIGLNAQTNSSNFGFNPYSKHKRFSFLSIDTKEVRVAFHDRLSAPLDLARRLRNDVRPSGAVVAMTLGPSGAIYFPKDGNLEFSAPAFTDAVIDATGAGDAFFAMASCLLKAGCPDPIVPFLSNVFAGLKTRIIGNKASVTRAQLMKAVAALLK